MERYTCRSPLKSSVQHLIYISQKVEKISFQKKVLIGLLKSKNQVDARQDMSVLLAFEISIKSTTLVKRHWFRTTSKLNSLIKVLRFLKNHLYFEWSDLCVQSDIYFVYFYCKVFACRIYWGSSLLFLRLSFSKNKHERSNIRIMFTANHYWQNILSSVLQRTLLEWKRGKCACINQIVRKKCTLWRSTNLKLIILCLVIHWWTLLLVLHLWFWVKIWSHIGRCSETTKTSKDVPTNDSI